MRGVSFELCYSLFQGVDAMVGFFPIGFDVDMKFFQAQSYVLDGCCEPYDCVTSFSGTAADVADSHGTYRDGSAEYGCEDFNHGEAEGSVQRTWSGRGSLKRV